MKKILLAIFLILLLIGNTWSATVIRDATYDAALDDIADNCNRLAISTDATVANALVIITLTVGDGNGDYVISDGDTSGRKLRILEQTGIANDTGTGVYYILYDSTDTANPYLATSFTGQTFTSGITYTINAFDPWEITDP